MHIGWRLAVRGAFNVVEGLVDHHLLRIRRLRDEVAAPLRWDLGFLVFGVALIGLGIVLAQFAPTRQEPALAGRPTGEQTRANGPA